MTITITRHDPYAGRNRYATRTFYQDNSRWVVVAIVVFLLGGGLIAHYAGGHYRTATKPDTDATFGQRFNIPVAAPRMIPLPPKTPDPVTAPNNL